MSVTEIDWQAPWLQGFGHHGQAVLDLWRSLNSLPGALNQYALNVGIRLDSRNGVNLEPASEGVNLAEGDKVTGPVDGLPFFVAQECLPEGLAYESFIYKTHRVPTRENLHDFFNALCWIRFPRTKSFLNAQQASAITHLGHVNSRGALRDALTLLDENACFVWCDELLWRALRAHDWKSAFGAHRDQWAHARVELFGHALLEKLCNPYKAITAHALRVGSSEAAPVPRWGEDESLRPHAEQTQRQSQSQSQSLACPLSDGELDRAILSTLQAVSLREKPFQALPVLGIPGWCEDNRSPSFYEDGRVFRPRRDQAPQSS